MMLRYFEMQKDQFSTPKTAEKTPKIALKKLFLHGFDDKILVDLGRLMSAGLTRPAECAAALETQDSSFQLSSFTSGTVDPTGVAGCKRSAHSAEPV